MCGAVNDCDNLYNSPRNGDPRCNRRYQISSLQIYYYHRSRPLADCKAGCIRGRTRYIIKVHISITSQVPRTLILAHLIVVFTIIVKKKRRYRRGRLELSAFDRLTVATELINPRVADSHGLNPLEWLVVQTDYGAEPFGAHATYRAIKTARVIYRREVDPRDKGNAKRKAPPPPSLLLPAR